MALIKNQLPKSGKVIIEIYQYEDVYRGWGHGKTLGYVNIDVAEMTQHPYLDSLVEIPDTYLKEYDKGEVGYDIIDEEKVKKQIVKIQQELQRLSMLSKNLLDVLA